MTNTQHTPSLIILDLDDTVVMSRSGVVVNGAEAFIESAQRRNIPLVLASMSDRARGEEIIKRHGLNFSRTAFRDDPLGETFDKSVIISRYLTNHPEICIDGPIWVIGNGYDDLMAAEDLAENNTNHDVVLFAVGAQCEIVVDNQEPDPDIHNIEMRCTDDFCEILGCFASHPEPNTFTCD